MYMYSISKNYFQFFMVLEKGDSFWAFIEDQVELKSNFHVYTAFLPRNKYLLSLCSAGPGQASCEKKKKF